MKVRTKIVGWSALFLFAAVLFIPSIVSFKAEAMPSEMTSSCPLAKQ